MKALKFISILVLCFLGVHDLYSQTLKEKIDAIYGLSPILYNGKIYSEFYGDKVKGHQFLLEKQTIKGDLIVQNQSFKNQQLNLDIYQQKVLLKYSDQNNAIQLIEISQHHLSEFSLEEKNFRVALEADSSFIIYQIIGNGSHQIFLNWYKKLQTISSNSSYDYQFSEAKKWMYLVIDSQWLSITNNKSLIKKIEEAKQKDLKRWLKENRIKIQKANDHQLYFLTNYLDSL